MERQLASIQRVSALTPIEGADLIEIARIEGWNAVVKKGEFQVGDLAVFLEIDSVPPDKKEFRFLWQPREKLDARRNAIPSTWDGVRPGNFRLRTMKLRGALSQGLLMPLSILPETDVYTADAETWEEGDDVTEWLGVTKYEPPVAGCPSYGVRGVDTGLRAPFPAYVPKTDEPRLQSNLRVLDDIRGLPYVITEKIDGSSATFLIDRFDETLHCCTRGRSAIDEASSLPWMVAGKYNIEEALRGAPMYAVQGEIYGPGVQSNRLKEAEVKFAVFNIYDFASGTYLNHYEAVAWCEVAGIPFVKALYEGDAFTYGFDDLLALAEGKYQNGGEREGIVIRPLTERASPALKGGRLSFKVISNRFLLKNADA